ncbi:MAG TPA: G1 family glutamic endopeptidase [Streptosporangiaceae bacterium]
MTRILHVTAAAAAAAAVALAAGAFTPAPAPGGPRPARVLTTSAARTAANVLPGQPMIPLRALANRPAASARGGLRVIRSVNWSGYAVTRSGKSFRRVQATFFVPYLDCKVAPGTYSASWVGFDGFTGARPDSVEQDGIEADCLGKAGKTPRYRAWYELFPKPEIVTGLAIKPGDSVTATVSYASRTAKFQLTVRDNTSGGHFAVTRACAAARCPRNSAQVISEAPASSKGALLPLADYGAVSFASMAVTDGAGRRGGLRSAHWRLSKIVQYGDATRNRIAQPTAVHADSFASYWLGRI